MGLCPCPLPDHPVHGPVLQGGPFAPGSHHGPSHRLLLEVWKILDFLLCLSPHHVAPLYDIWYLVAEEMLTTYTFLTIDSYHILISTTMCPSIRL